MCARRGPAFVAEKWRFRYSGNPPVGRPLGSLGAVLGSDGSRATVAIWVAAALLGGFALLHLAGGRGSDGGAPVRIDRAPASGWPAPAARRAAAASTCTSRGRCGSPGSCICDDGARVAEALERAGGPGPRADLAGVNLAARLEDGQQVIVPVRGAGGAAGAATAAPAAPARTAARPRPAAPACRSRAWERQRSSSSTRSTASARPWPSESSSTARSTEASARLAELREVEGIGEKRFEGLREALQP